MYLDNKITKLSYDIGLLQCKCNSKLIMKTRDFIEQQQKRINNGDKLETTHKHCASVMATDNAIYSYGYHYPLLWQVETPSRRKLWVCNDGGYSNTTAKHTSYARGLADVLAPIGGSYSFGYDLPSYEKVVHTLSDKLSEIKKEMDSKSRHDTQVYKYLQSEYQTYSNFLTVLEKNHE